MDDGNVGFLHFFYNLFLFLIEFGIITSMFEMLLKFF